MDPLATVQQYAPHAETSRCARYGLVLPENSTNDSAFSAPADSLTKPTNGSGWGWVLTPAAMVHEIVFFGTDAANETGIVTLVGATELTGANSTNSQKARQLVYSPIASLAVTLGARTGVLGGVVNENQFYADAITVSNDYTIPSLGILKAATPADWVQRIYVDVTGFQMIGFHFDRDGSSASLNALIRGI